MNTPNSQNHLPEARGRGREDELERRQSYALLVQRAWANTKQAFSATPDMHYAEGTVSQPQTVTHPVVAQSIRPAVEREPHHEVDPISVEAMLATPRMEEGQVESANAAYINSLLEQDEPDALALQEQAKTEAVQQVIDAYRAAQNLPMDIPLDGPAPAAPELTPLQRAEQDFPSNAMYMVGDHEVSMGDIRDQVNGAFDDTEELV